MYEAVLSVIVGVEVPIEADELVLYCGHRTKMLNQEIVDLLLHRWDTVMVEDTELWNCSIAGLHPASRVAFMALNSIDAAVLSF